MSITDFSLTLIRPTMLLVAGCIYILPALLCVRKFHSLMSHRQRIKSRFQQHRPIADIVALAILFVPSVEIATIFFQALFDGRRGYLWFAASAAVVIALALLGLCDKVIMKPELMRSFAPDSSMQALGDLARRNWWIYVNFAIFNILFLSVVKSAAHANAKLPERGPDLAAQALGYVLLFVVGLVSIRMTPGYLACEILLFYEAGNISRDLGRSGSLVDADLLIRPDGLARAALRSFSRKLLRQSRRIERVSPSHPLVIGFAMTAAKIGAYLDSPRSLDGSVEPWILDLMPLCANVIAGGCPPSKYHEFLAAVGAVNDDGEMVQFDAVHSSKVREFVGKLTGGIESTSQTVGAFVKIAVVLLLLVLASTGQLGLLGLADKLR